MTVLHMCKVNCYWCDFIPLLRYGDSLHFRSRIQVELTKENSVSLPESTKRFKYLHDDFAEPQYYPNLKMQLC